MAFFTRQRMSRIIRSQDLVGTMIDEGVKYGTRSLTSRFVKKRKVVRAPSDIDDNPTAESVQQNVQLQQSNDNSTSGLGFIGTVMRHRKMASKMANDNGGVENILRPLVADEEIDIEEIASTFKWLDKKLNQNVKELDNRIENLGNSIFREHDILTTNFNALKKRTDIVEKRIAVVEHEVKYLVLKDRMKSNASNDNRMGNNPYRHPDAKSKGLLEQLLPLLTGAGNLAMGAGGAAAWMARGAIMSPLGLAAGAFTAGMTMNSTAAGKDSFQNLTGDLRLHITDNGKAPKIQQKVGKDWIEVLDVDVSLGSQGTLNIDDIELEKKVGKAKVDALRKNGLIGSAINLKSKGGNPSAPPTMPNTISSKVDAEEYELSILRMIKLKSKKIEFEADEIVFKADKITGLNDGGRRKVLKEYDSSDVMREYDNKQTFTDWMLGRKSKGSGSAQEGEQSAEEKTYGQRIKEFFSRGGSSGSSETGSSTGGRDPNRPLTDDEVKAVIDSGEALKDIDPNVLKFIRSVGARETNFNENEAYSESYNQPGNNANVRKYGQKGADYGYFQTNEMDVDHAIKLGVPKEIARHLNGGGSGGKSTPEQQSYAMSEYLKRLNPQAYEELKKGNWSAGNQAFKGKWPSLPGGLSYRSSNDEAANDALAGRVKPGMVSGKDTNNQFMNKFLETDNGKAYADKYLNGLTPGTPEYKEALGRMRTEGGKDLDKAMIEHYRKLNPDSVAKPNTLSPSTGESNVIETQQRVAGIRKLPIKDELKEILDLAGEKAGVKFIVSSGGQHRHGPETGTKRHNVDVHGTIGAGDGKLQIEENGRKRFLNINNPDDREKIKIFNETFAKHAPSAGVGTNYMGTGKERGELFHFGGGNFKGDAPTAYAGPDWFKDSFRKGNKQFGTPEAKAEMEQFRQARAETLRRKEEFEKQKNQAVIDPNPVPPVDPERLEPKPPKEPTPEPRQTQSDGPIPTSAPGRPDKNPTSTNLSVSHNPEEEAPKPSSSGYGKNNIGLQV